MRHRDRQTDRHTHTEKEREKQRYRHTHIKRDRDIEGGECVCEQREGIMRGRDTALVDIGVYALAVPCPLDATMHAHVDSPREVRLLGRPNVRTTAVYDIMCTKTWMIC